MNDKPLEPKNIEGKELDNIESLTNSNWLFIKYLFKGNTVKDSYHLAGYTSTNDSAPYVLHNRLKKAIQSIVESDGVDRIRLLMEAKKLLDIPLNPEKVTLTFSEKLRSLKLLAAVIPQQREAATINISKFVINRYQNGKDGASVPLGEVIQATDISEQGKPLEL